jgi:hypothetical protein
LEYQAKTMGLSVLIRHSVGIEINRDFHLLLVNLAVSSQVAYQERS